MICSLRPLLFSSSSFPLQKMPLFLTHWHYTTKSRLGLGLSHTIYLLFSLTKTTARVARASQACHTLRSASTRLRYSCDALLTDTHRTAVVSYAHAYASLAERCCVHCLLPFLHASNLYATVRLRTHCVSRSCLCECERC